MENNSLIRRGKQLILLIEGKNFYSFGDGVADFMEDIYEIVRTVLLANVFFSFFHLQYWSIWTSFLDDV